MFAGKTDIPGKKECDGARIHYIIQTEEPKNYELILSILYLQTTSGHRQVTPPNMK